MAIQVICPGCHKRFSVADQHAGKEGPCPSCKQVITIPLASDEVKIHAPVHSEMGAVDSKGRPVLKTKKASSTKFDKRIALGIFGATLLVLLAAFLLKPDPGGESIGTGILALGAIILGPLLSYAGYTFLRDQELGEFQGMELLGRIVGCGLVHALMWGVILFLTDRLVGTFDFTIGTGLLMLIVFGAGTLASFATLDLDPFMAAMHFGLYFGVTVVMRLLMDLPALPKYTEGLDDFAALLLTPLTMIML